MYPFGSSFPFFANHLWNDRHGSLPGPQNGGLHHAGVLILLYSELMILALAIFFWLYPV